MSIWIRIREIFFGSSSIRKLSGKSAATALIEQIAHGGLRSLSDDKLMSLVGVLLDNTGTRVPLRGNARFLDSVARQWSRKGSISARQRQGILNVLERAYPHNLAAELGNL